MADNMNMELNDEMLAGATGGVGGGQPEPKFKVGDHVKAIDDDPNWEAFITGIHGYYSLGWYYKVNARDEEGWFDSIEWEKNMKPF